MVKLSRFYSTSLYFLMIIIIGMINYYTISDMAFLLFYLVPIMLIARQKGVKNSILILSVLLSSFFWSASDYYLEIYSNTVFVFIWNSFVRFAVFSLTSYLTSNLRRKYDKILFMNEELERKNKFIELALKEMMDKKRE